MAKLNRRGEYKAIIPAKDTRVNSRILIKIKLKLEDSKMSSAQKLLQNGMEEINPCYEADEVVNLEDTTEENLRFCFVEGQRFDEYKIEMPDLKTVMAKHKVIQIVVRKTFDYLFVGTSQNIRAVIDYMVGQGFRCENFEKTYPAGDEEITKAYTKCINNNQSHIVLTEYFEPNDPDDIYYKAKLELDALLDSEDVLDRLWAVFLIRYASKKISYDYDNVVKSQAIGEYVCLEHLMYDDDEDIRSVALGRVKMLYEYGKIQRPLP